MVPVVNQRNTGATTMSRKILFWLITTVVVVTGLAADAQQPAKIPHIGFLLDAPVSAMAARIEGFRQGLRDLGYVEGKNIVIEWRSAEGNLDRRPALAAELVGLKVDVLVSPGPTVTRALREATSTIPIVMGQDIDPVGSGFAISLARPGGNITGLASLTHDLSGKRLELIKEAVPNLSRVAVFVNPSDPSVATAVKELQPVAKGLGLTVYTFEIRSAADIDKGFQAAMKIHAGALMAISDPITFTHRKQVADLAIKKGLPS